MVNGLQGLAVWLGSGLGLAIGVGCFPFHPGGGEGVSSIAMVCFSGLKHKELRKSSNPTIFLEGEGEESLSLGAGCWIALILGADLPSTKHS